MSRLGLAILLHATPAYTDRLRSLISQHPGLDVNMAQGERSRRRDQFIRSDRRLDHIRVS